MNYINIAILILAAIGLIFQYRSMIKGDKLTKLFLMIAIITLLCTNFIVISINTIGGK
jgi:hypothetical protein